MMKNKKIEIIDLVFQFLTLKPISAVSNTKSNKSTMEYNFEIQIQSSKKSNNKKPKIHVNARRRKIQKERRSKVRGNRISSTIKIMGLNHDEFKSSDPEMDIILENNYENTIISARETKKENALFQKYFQFLEEHRMPHENVRIEDVISFEEYKKALKKTEKNIINLKKVYRIYKSPDGDVLDYSDDEHDDDEDYDFGRGYYQSRCTGDNDDENQETLTELLYKYEGEHNSLCGWNMDALEELEYMLKPMKQTKSARGGY